MVHTTYTANNPPKGQYKKYKIQQKGTTLIAIPCWWDGNLASLQATILFERPDLFLETSEDPVPLNPPLSFFEGYEILDVGELMVASLPLNTNFFDSISRNWWLGEKYDGVRCCWNPKQTTVYSRHGATIEFHHRICERLPPIFLDAEIWFGRRLYNFSYSLFKGDIESIHWHFLRLVCFDTPAKHTSTKPFEERYKIISLKIKPSNPFCILASRILCSNKTAVFYLNKEIIDQDGEGIILRKVGSTYDRGKSPFLLKLKVSYGDQEGLVMGVDRGSVLLKLPDGKFFTVPPESVHIASPSQGDVVTFTFDEYAKRDIPVNAQIVRVRHDVAWEHVVHSAALEDASEKNSPKEPPQPPGYWSMERMRSAISDLVKKKNMDPLLSDTWHKITSKSLYQTKVGEAILRKLKGFSKMLQTLFPSVSVDKSKTKNEEFEQRRNFFVKFAKKRGFDPLVAENWYAQERHLLTSEPGGARIIKQYARSLPAALLDLFPNIGLMRSRFSHAPHWYSPAKRRKFFEDYARANRFDPLNPENWYLQPTYRSAFSKELKTLLASHRNSFPQALIDLFPEIGLDRTRFSRKSYWVSKNQRKFFEDYAQTQGFDPLIPDNWYKQSRRNIKKLKRVSKILTYHGSVSLALINLFPEIGLDKRKFKKHASGGEAKHSYTKEVSSIRDQPTRV